jgi:hypothetical protein
MRPQDYLLESAAIFTQRHFVAGAAVHVIEHRARQPSSGHAAQIFDADNLRRIWSSHRPYL